jgi:hypothetical protein
MKPLFELYQTRKFTFDEKILYIFEMLINELKPVKTGKNSIVYDRIYNGITYTHREYYDIISVNIENLQNTKIPFKDIQLEIAESEIKIFNDTFCYTFQPNMILLVYNRFKKLKFV